MTRRRCRSRASSRHPWRAGAADAARAGRRRGRRPGDGNARGKREPDRFPDSALSRPIERGDIDLLLNEGAPVQRLDFLRDVNDDFRFGMIGGAGLSSRAIRVVGGEDFEERPAEFFEVASEPVDALCSPGPSTTGACASAPRPPSGNSPPSDADILRRWPELGSRRASRT